MWVHKCNNFVLMLNSLSVWRHCLPGQTWQSSAYDALPVIRSGHDSSAASKASASISEALWMRGFWNATLSKSIGSESGSSSCEIRASTVQSSPPEKRIASRAGVDEPSAGMAPSNVGGSGMFSTRSARESRRSCSSRTTDGDCFVS
jgi:hypothetical protein